MVPGNPRWSAGARPKHRGNTAPGSRDGQDMLAGSRSMGTQRRSIPNKAECKGCHVWIGMNSWISGSTGRTAAKALGGETGTVTAARDLCPTAGQSCSRLSRALPSTMQEPLHVLQALCAWPTHAAIIQLPDHIGRVGSAVVTRGKEIPNISRN